MRLGYSRGHYGDGLMATASMRPRRMRLGYGPIYQRDQVKRGQSFNEAEAHAPRILTVGRVQTPTLARFNEAEAHAPRIRHYIDDP